VIQRAKEAGIRLFLLGFGRKHEIDEATMKEMADATGGQYHHAPNEEALVKIFEELSIGLHDDGIDEATLKQLAHDTGGQYYPAKDVDQLRFILEQVTQSIQKKSYEEVFESTRPVADGSPRRVAIYLMYGALQVSNTAAGVFMTLKDGQVIGPKQTGGVQVTGVVAAEMHHLIYLFFLAILGTLIALPAWMQRLATRS